MRDAFVESHPFGFPLGFARGFGKTGRLLRKRRARMGHSTVVSKSQYYVPHVHFVDNGELWMAVKHSGQVSAFVDESGKFKDHKVIAIGCVAGYNEQVGEFAQEWGRQLFLNGLNDLSAKAVLNYSRPLSKKN